MKNYFFVGGTEGNAGPSNVNRGIVANLTDEFDVIRSKNKYAKFVEATFKTFGSKIVIVSGMSRNGFWMIKLAKFLGKKTVYIMHGCYEIEVVLNQFTVNLKLIRMEKDLMRYVTHILCVSKRYSEMIQSKYPEIASKVGYLHNGINKVYIDSSNIKRVKGTIIAIGGDRKQKNNSIVAEAMKKVKGSSVLTVYGHLYEPDRLPKDCRIQFKGLVSQEQLYREMMASELFVLNSLHESFSLAVFDALFCGCSILVTRMAGALELLDVTDCDIINNPMDVDEIAQKIAYLLEHPNNERILKSLDLDNVSYKSEVTKLKKICDRLIS